MTTSDRERAADLARRLGTAMGDEYEEQVTLADTVKVALRMQGRATQMCFETITTIRKETAEQAAEMVRGGCMFKVCGYPAVDCWWHEKAAQIAALGESQ